MSDDVRYGYILDTTHGEHHFNTAEHHENHPGGIKGWFDDIEHHIVAVLDAMQKASTTVVNVLNIYESVQGRRGKRVPHPNE
jgi:hypothetical protein